MGQARCEGLSEKDKGPLTGLKPKALGGVSESEDSKSLLLAPAAHPRAWGSEPVRSEAPPSADTREGRNTF